MVAPWPKMVAETKWQSPVYTGEGPSGADVVVGVWSCQPITADHVTGRGAWLPGQTTPEAAGKGTGLLLGAGDRALAPPYLLCSWHLRWSQPCFQLALASGRADVGLHPIHWW